MRAVLALVLAGLAVSASAHAATYDTALAVMQEVNAQNRYVYYTAKDFTPMVKGERGNCARFAATYADRMNRQGVETNILTTNMKGVGPHAVAVTVDGIVLDVRSLTPKTIQEFMAEE